jgi:hypothetical protein
MPSSDRVPQKKHWRMVQFHQKEIHNSSRETTSVARKRNMHGEKVPPRSQLHSWIISGAGHEYTKTKL